MQYFHLFCKKISKPCVKFSRSLTKNTIGWGNFKNILKVFDENSIENLKFNLFLGKPLAKTRAFGNNIIFYNNFSGWGGVESPNPLHMPLQLLIFFYLCFWLFNDIHNFSLLWNWVVLIISTELKDITTQQNKFFDIFGNKSIRKIICPRQIHLSWKYFW